jgi:hypothetical protein
MLTQSTSSGGINLEDILAADNATARILSAAGARHVVATGRRLRQSDQQLTHVHGRVPWRAGCRAPDISQAMKRAAVEAIAGLVTDDELHEDLHPAQYV